MEIWPALGPNLHDHRAGPDVAGNPPRRAAGGQRMRTRRAAAVHGNGSGEEKPLSSYPNISDHGLIGDLQTAALVATDGTVDFFCCPRFDSPSVFASLLDAEGGG